MKYKMKVDLSFPAHENKETILKGEVFEVFMIKEFRDKVIVYCITEKQYWKMYLETLQLFAEEYYEPQERKTCPTCKHRQECMIRVKEAGILFLGDFCARYEKLQEPDKPAQESESAKHL